MGNSFGGKLALWLVQQPELVQALILVAPAAIRPEGSVPPQALYQRNSWPVVRTSERQAPLLPGPGNKGQATGPGAPHYGTGA